MTEQVVAQFTCEGCGKNTKRRTWQHRVKLVRFCTDCIAERRRAAQRAAMCRKREEQEREGRSSGSRCYCGEPALRGAFCKSHGLQAWRRGVCDRCGRPMASRWDPRARKSRVVCDHCESPSRTRTGRAVEVTLTDGERFRRTWVGATSRIGGHMAQCWIAPVVLVPAVDRGRVLSGAPVVSGVAVDYCGQTLQMLLGEIVRAGARSLEAVRDLLEREGGTANMRPWVASLKRAGLLDERGLTPRADAVVAWCRAAGVRL